MYRKILATFLVMMCLMTTNVSAYVKYDRGMSTSTFTVNNRCTGDYKIAVDNAINEWNKVSVVTITQSSNSNNIIENATYEAEWAGYYTPSTHKKKRSFNIKLNNKHLDSRSFNTKQSVAIHELGHALSLADNPPETQSIMRYDRNRDTMIAPQDDDIKGVIEIYSSAKPGKPGKPNK